jgi:excisionase family DNA binding protein
LRGNRRGNTRRLVSVSFVFGAAEATMLFECRQKQLVTRGGLPLTWPTERVCDLPDDLVDELARRVAALLEPSGLSPYLSVSEAADVLRCKPQRIYDLLSSRRLTRFKDGSRVLLSREEIDTYLKEAATWD